MSLPKACLLLAATLICAPVGRADDEVERKEPFYERDYARSPVEIYKEDHSKSRDLGQASSSGQDSSGTTSGSNTPKAIIEQGPETELATSQGKKIISLGVVVNAADRAHFKAVLDTYLRVLNEHKFLPRQVVQVGLDSTKFDEGIANLYHRLAILGTDVTSDEAYLEKYKVKKSPTWILELKDGDVLLEGVDSPERFINSQDSFVPPQDFELHAEDEAPTPVPSPAS